MHAERRNGRQRSRLLYWFRTPPGVKVGRAALDEGAIRLIETTHPDVEFDWTRILKGQGEGGDSRLDRPDRPDRPDRNDRTDRGPRPDRGTAERPPRRQGREGREARDERPAPPPDRGRGSRPPADPRDQPPRPESPAFTPAPSPDSPRPLPPPPPSPRPAAVDAFPAAQEPPEPPVLAAVDALPPELASGPAHLRLGTEGLVRLRGRYAEILARIGERGLAADEDAQMREEAERLNPDTWVTDDEVSHGLEQYEAGLERLRAVVGLRRRRRRRGSRPAGEANPEGQTETGPEPSNGAATDHAGAAAPPADAGPDNPND